LAELTLEEGTLKAVGTLSYESQDEFGRLADEMLDSAAKALTVDLVGVDYVFSAYLGGLMELHAGAADRGKTLKILIPPGLQDLFESTGLTKCAEVEVVE